MSEQQRLAGVLACIDLYCEAMREGSGDHIRRCFHEDGRIVGPDDGSLGQMTREEFAKLVDAKGPHPELDERILSVQLDGGIATARVSNSYIGRRFVDHIAMVELAGRWQIFTKLWHVEAKL